MMESRAGFSHSTGLRGRRPTSVHGSCAHRPDAGPRGMRGIIEFNGGNDARVGVQDQKIERRLADAIPDRLGTATALKIEYLPGQCG